MKYKVVSISLPGYDKHYVDAMDMRRKYGLFHLSVDEVMRRWYTHCHEHWHVPGWYGDGAAATEEIEQVFGVLLEESED